jgi:hypothetical protein
MENSNRIQINGVWYVAENTERMYSEADIKKAIDLARELTKTNENDGYDEYTHTSIEIIQQFKKK